MARRTREDLVAQINTRFNDNTTGQITPERARAMFLDIVDSFLNLQEDYRYPQKKLAAISPIVLDFESKPEQYFYSTSAIGTDMGLSITNNSIANHFEYTYTTSSMDIYLTLPSDFECSDSRWDSGGKTFRHFDPGTYKMIGTKINDIWLFDVSQSIYI